MTDCRKHAKPNRGEEGGDTSCTWCHAFGSLASAVGKGIKKLLSSNRVLFGVVESRASLPLLPVCLCRERGTAKLGDYPGCPFPSRVLSQTWLMLPAEVGQGEAQGSRIQQQSGFGLCNFGQAVGLQVALQLLAGWLPCPVPAEQRDVFMAPWVLRAGGAFGDTLGTLPSSHRAER